MGFILIAVVLALLLFFLYRLPYNCIRDFFYDHEIPIVVISAMLIFTCLVLGCLYTPKLYEGPYYSHETELVSLNDAVSASGTGTRYYLSVTPDNSYTYYYETSSRYADTNEKAYKSNTLSSNNVTIIETDDTTATLQVYTWKLKGCFWSFQLETSREVCEYVFRVPKGTILQQVVLGN